MFISKTINHKDWEAKGNSPIPADPILSKAKTKDELALEYVKALMLGDTTKITEIKDSFVALNWLREAKSNCEHTGFKKDSVCENAHSLILKIEKVLKIQKK